MGSKELENKELTKVSFFWGLITLSYTTVAGDAVKDESTPILTDLACDAPEGENNGEQVCPGHLRADFNGGEWIFSCDTCKTEWGRGQFEF